MAKGPAFCGRKSVSAYADAHVAKAGEQSVPECRQESTHSSAMLQTSTTVQRCSKEGTIEHKPVKITLNHGEHIS